MINEMFCSHASTYYQIKLPNDFLMLSLKGMKHLSETKRMNVLYELVRGLRIMRPDDGMDPHCYARVWRFRILHRNKWTWAEPFEMNVKIEQELNFIVDNDSRLFLDAQEAKKVSECTVDR